MLRNFIYLLKLCYDKAKVPLIGFFIFTVLAAITSVGYNFYSGKLIDIAIGIVANKGVFLQILPYLLGMLGLLLAMSVAEKVREYFHVLYNNSLTLLIDSYKYQKNLELDAQSYLDPAFTSKKQILEQNGWKVVVLPKIAIEFVSSALPVLCYILILLSYDLRIGILAVLSAIPFVYSNIQSGKRIWSIWEDNSDITAHYNMYKNALWGDITDIKLLNAGHYILTKLQEMFNRFLSMIMKSEKKLLRSLLLSTIFEYSILGLAYALLFQGVIDQKFSVGAFFIITTALWTVKRQLDSAFGHLSILLSDNALLTIFVEYMNMQPKVVSPIDGIKLDKHTPISITFEHVWFQYPNSDTWIFKDLSFEIKPDEDIAVVGRNGIGKTTLMRLITRLYDPSKGTIKINGIPLPNIDLASYHSLLGSLSQDFRVHEFSARENIGIGDTKKPFNSPELIEAAKLAGADTFLDKLPKGYDTFLTSKISGGQSLSGGQLQRIAIARVFFKQPKLLILDEPTSAVDALAEEQIFNNIFDHAQNKTVIIVSHRFKTIKRARRILVLDKGTIVEDGTHDSLIKQAGLYREMYTAQEG